MKIAFLIRALERGGAERQLINTAVGLKKDGHSVTVAVFYGGGHLEVSLREQRIPVVDLKKTGRWDILGFFWRVLGWLRRERPNVLYSFLVSANLVGSLLKPFVPDMRTVWGVRASNMKLEKYDRISRWAFGLSRIFSHSADLIIVNSVSGRNYHASKGYPVARMVVLPNGIDTEAFKRNERAGADQRKEWGVREGERIVGLVARLDPMKDHENFLLAASIVANENDTVRFVCVGDGPRERVVALKAYAERLGIGRRLIWEEGRADMVGVYSALDIAVSASVSEGFSNTLSEAMACGVPCVATDVGDSREIVGNTGILVPPSDSRALANGILKMVERLKREHGYLGERARERICTYYDLDRLVAGTNRELKRIVQ